MPTELLQHVVDGEAPDLFQFTVDQYHQMTESGVLVEGSPIELLDGMLVLKDRRDCPSEPPMNVGPFHATVASELHLLLHRLVVPHGCCARCQQPVALPPDHVPEPDVSVLAGSLRDYRRRHPEPADILAVMEVADSSLRHDRGTKQRIYADAAIPAYWVVDLANEQLEVYTHPQPGSGRYAEMRTHVRGETVELSLPGGASVTVVVDDVLPR